MPADPPSFPNPELRWIAAVLPRGVVGPRRLAAMRWAQALQRPRRTPNDIEIVSLGPVGIRLQGARARAEPGPAVLWMHGGGFVMGHAAQGDAFCRLLAAELGAIVASVDYRLAPEHPFPAGVEDCHDALRWLAARADVDRDRIAIGGASAGGGLAAALALLARDRGEVSPAFQLLRYPMLDDRTAAREDPDARRRRLWNKASNHFGWRSYLGNEPGADGISSRAAPARAEDLAGLPPAWIGVGSHDLFAAEDTTYAGRLREAGVPCELEVVVGGFHGFDVIRPRAAVSRRFQKTQIAALAAGLGCRRA